MASNSIPITSAATSTAVITLTRDLRDERDEGRRESGMTLDRSSNAPATSRRRAGTR